ncbi:MULTISPECIES: hypothetical protein [unclassified Mesorhizobium]|uniref:hypothetical protein n=1 Tax=unclassified Mesorhizobium TaxID=325217 RepID=UPI00109393B8|nr:MULTISPECIES: hypothetical protein [unclassified Mesorhizobium]TGT90874.1 hypothetical protein EN804_05935 [Mesorhizobium sp. M8A.F.Ca.ET.161.01.1.1]TGV43846.1 hypothetical protein EN785_07610 [Mesorhizobium sp. M8A.F.Ca.ET.142.01.1.1]
MTALPWDDLKVCFACGDNTERLWNAMDSGRLTLPTGWQLNETSISGASGYVAIFRVDVLPVPADAYRVKAELRRWTR